MTTESRTPQSAGVSQAKALREQARKGGLRFEAYLPSGLAEWVLDMIEREVFTDPAEAVFVILGDHKELQSHRDLRDELLRRRIQASIDDPHPSLTSNEVAARLGQVIASKAPPARWQKEPSGPPD
jgi:antitoxin ParD1/3/4